MTENDYLDVTNLARLRHAYNIVHDCFPSGDVNIDQEIKDARLNLRTAIDKLEKKEHIKL